MPKRLNAVEAITPAFEQTKRQLFKPFRWGRWVRLAWVALVTGEFAGGGGGGGGNGARFNLPQGRGKRDLDLLSFISPTWDTIREFLPWIALLLVILIALVLLWLYAASVYRFILLDSVLRDRCELRAGWHQWKQQGSSFFLFIVVFAIALSTLILVVIGGPIFAAWRAGLFAHPRENLAALIAGGVLLFFVLLGILVAASVVALFVKDFAVPLMALENLGVREAWRRLVPMLAAEKLAYAGYVLMKIVLAVGSAIIFGIINLLIVLALLIPLGIGAAVLYFAAQGAGFTWNAVTITLVVLAATVVLTVLFFVMAFVSTPAMVFFQSYTLHFFGSRYATLGEVVFPPPPPLPPEEPAPSLPIEPAPAS
jgi:hypothetical protein